MGSSNTIPDYKYYKEEDQLRNGQAVTLRAIRSTDKLALLNGFRRLSKESIHARFFGGKHDLSESELKFFTELDFKTHVALVMELQEDSTPLGVGRFNVNSGTNPLNADIAITVDESSHGNGVGTLLLNHLVHIGRNVNVSEFKADILSSNTHMLNIISRLGLPVRKRKNGELINLSIIIQES
jgi:GNAT superfamily N-acetyltransferase